MTEPVKDPTTDYKVATQPEIYKTEKQVKEEEVKAQAELEPPAVKEEPTIVVKPEPVVTKPSQTPFRKSVKMTKVKKPTNVKWKEAYSVTSESFTGKGSLSVFMHLKEDAPPEITYTYEMDSAYIDEIIAEILSKNNNGEGTRLYHQAIKVSFWKKDRTMYGYAWLYFYASYSAASGQIAFETGYRVADETTEFVWDSEVFKDDPV